MPGVAYLHDHLEKVLQILVNLHFYGKDHKQNTT